MNCSKYQMPSTFSDHAMMFLKRAIADGWNKWSHAATDPDLLPLHKRQDFQKLILDRIFPVEPFAITDDRARVE